MGDAAVEAARARLRAKLGNVKIGGKGSVRRKRRVTKSAGTEDKKVQLNLRRLGVQPIPGIDEVNMFLDDDESVLSFKNPKVQAAVQSNTFAISGNPSEKKISEMLPSVLTQLDQKTLLNYISKMKTSEAGGEVVADADKAEEEEAEDLGDVQDFEEVSKQ